MHAGKKIVLALCWLGLVACSNVPRVITEYRIDIQQGNVLSQEMVAQLRPGLNKEQVRYLLGTPVLMDVFHSQRWDYIYRLQRGIDAKPILRRFSVFFDQNGLLERVDGDLEVASTADLEMSTQRVRVVDLSQLPEGETLSRTPDRKEKNWWGSFTEKLGF